MTSNNTRLRVLALYKELHRLGRDYPDPGYVEYIPPYAKAVTQVLSIDIIFTESFEVYLRVCFEYRPIILQKSRMCSQRIKDSRIRWKSRKLLHWGNTFAMVRAIITCIPSELVTHFSYYLIETLALYSLRKYRHLKRMYPAPPVAESLRGSSNLDQK
jgi:hypothetical protein